MKRRLIASLAMGAAVVLTTSGCAMLSTQATTIQYSPADGVNVYNEGPLLVRNALIVTDEVGADGNLVAAIVNPTDKGTMLKIEVADGGPSTQVWVDANSVLSLGDGDTPAELLEGIDTPPGADVSVYFQSGDVDGSVVDVPVLDGELTYLADHVPGFNDPEADLNAD